MIPGRSVWQNFAGLLPSPFASAWKPDGSLSAFLSQQGEHLGSDSVTDGAKQKQEKKGP
jgi:hypothetical protein